MLDYIQAYDRFPYPSMPHRMSHPDHLETIARLFHVPVASSESARVLEIGAASGGNVIPLAEQLPGSRFVAIDLSANQVAAGNRVIQRLGLANIDLRHADLTALDDSYGKFDYIICQGVFSWVPEPVRLRLLQVCRERLAPQGIAYVSYNTYPGCHMLEMLRCMLLFHLRGVSEPVARVQEARRFVSWLADSVIDKNSAYSQFLNDQKEFFTRAADGYLLHDILEENNQPVYFHQFHELAEQHQFVYLADSQMKSVSTPHLFPETPNATAPHSATLVEREQATDFVLNRSFRQSLLCHQGTAIDRSISIRMIRDLYISSSLRIATPETSTSLKSSPSTVDFVDRDRVRRLSTQDPLLVALMQSLQAAYPGSLPFTSLAQTALPNRNTESTSQEAYFRAEKALAETLIHLYSKGLIDFRVHPDRFTTQVSDKPQVSPLAALQASEGQAEITNRQHRLASCEPLLRLVMQLADGSRSRQQIAQALAERVSTADLDIKSQLPAINASGADLARFFNQSTDMALETLARRCWLIA